MMLSLLARGSVLLLVACSGVPGPMNGSAGALSIGGSGGGTSSASGGTSAAGGNPTGGKNSTSGSSAGGASSGGSVSYTGTFPSNPSSVTTTNLTLGGNARTVAVYRPTNATSNAALFILYHGTGGDGQSFIQDMNATSVASQYGFVVVAPNAKTNVMGGPADVDHWEAQVFSTGWNLSDKDPSVNDDVLLTRAIIEAAVSAYGINRKRVYTFGMSNGAFFSPMVAFLLPSQIAGFGENSGGAIRCANRGDYGAQWMGQGTTCAALEREPNYPSCSGTLKPAEVPTSRVPWGYLVHFNDDNTVSVAWTCTLADAMGSYASTTILTGGGHSIAPNALANAWTTLSTHSIP